MQINDEEAYKILAAGFLYLLYKEGIITLNKSMWNFAVERLPKGCEPWSILKPALEQLFGPEKHTTQQ